eukprot:SAG31_NODE_510_length_14725_cov_2.829482_5_plen_601_part_00
MAGALVTAEWLTRVLQASPACRGPPRTVESISVAPLPNVGKTGAQLLRVAIQYAIAAPSEGEGEGEGSDAAHSRASVDGNGHPASVVVKLAERAGLQPHQAWLRTQDLHEVDFYKAVLCSHAAQAHGVQSSRELQLPAVYHAAIDTVDAHGEAQTCRQRMVLVLQDLSVVHNSGEELCGVLRTVPAGAQKAAALCRSLVRMLARFHCGDGLAAEAAAACMTAEPSRPADFLLSTCFKIGPDHEAAKAVLAQVHVDEILARRATTGCMLAVEWAATGVAAEDRAAFEVALAQATPGLRQPEVLSTLRAVARCWATYRQDPEGAAARCWARMDVGKPAGCRGVQRLHGDFHPGNLLFSTAMLESILLGELPYVTENAPAARAEDGPFSGGGSPALIDFQHCGMGPVAAELLYFFFHARTMWALPSSALPALLADYVSTWAETERGRGTESKSRNPSVVEAPLVADLVEEMLAIAVEWTASFLVDDAWDHRIGAANTKRTMQRHTIQPVIAAAISTAVVSTGTGCGETERDSDDSREVVALETARIHFEMSDAASPGLGQAASGCLTWAWRQSAMLQMTSDLLHRSWAANGTPLARTLTSGLS